MLPKKFQLTFVVSFLVFLILSSPSKTNALSQPIISEPVNPPNPYTAPSSQRVRITNISFDTTRLKVYLSLPSQGINECYVIQDVTLPAGTASSYEFFWNTTSVVDLVDPNYYVLRATAYAGTSSVPSLNYTFLKTENSLTGTACNPPSPASVDLKANDSQGPITISSGSSASISWSSVNVQNCIVYNNGSQVGSGKNGSFSTGSLTTSQTYYANCYGLIGPASDSVEVNVVNNNPPPPSSSPPPSSAPPPSSSTPPPTTTSTQTTTGETIISPETVTSEILASEDKLVIEEEIPVSITEFDPDVFLKGNNIKLSVIKNVKKGEKNFIYFEGKTKPNTLVTLYIFSNPIIVTLKSDSKGNWNYEREKRIETGKHSAFATIYDEGVTRRSDVTNFFIAKNSSGNLILKQTAFDNLYLYALIIGGVIAFSIIILIMYRIYIGRKVKGS